jgi:hypothetical protein
MKFRSLLTLAGLVIGFAGPAFAQQKDATDPQIIQQLEEIGRKNDEAFNRNDAGGRSRALHRQRGLCDAEGTCLWPS